MHGGCRRAAVGMALAVGMLCGACTSGPSDEVPERAEPPTTAATTTTSSTTSTTEVPAEFEPLIADPDQPIRDQVEAAYLHHWDVLMDAGRTGRTDNLPLVFTGAALDVRMAEFARMEQDGFRLDGFVEHNYEISVVSDDYAVVIDGYRNYVGRVDAETRAPLGEPTGREFLYEFQLRKADGQWRVDNVIQYSLPD